MKQPVAVEIIEFSSKRIMASTCKILVISAILLAYLSLSSAIVNQNINVSKNLKKDVTYDIQHFLREKREEDTEDFFKEIDNPVKLEEKFLEPETINDKKIIKETINQSTERKDKEQEEHDAFHGNNDTKTDAEVIIKICY